MKFTFKRFSWFIMTVCSLLFLVACGGQDGKAKTEKTERIPLELSILSINESEDGTEVKVEFNSNLPEDLAFKDVELQKEYAKQVGQYTIHNENNTSSVAYFYFVGEEPVEIQDGEYTLSIEAEVQYEGENGDFLFNFVLGGYPSEMEEYYHDSKTVKINKKDHNHYILEVESKPFSVENKEPSREEDTESLRTDTTDSTDEALLEQAYIAQMKEHAGMMGDEIGRFGEYFENPRINDQNRMVDVTVTIVKISRLSKMPQSFEVPARYKETHAKYMTAMDLYYISMDMFPSALDNQDATEIEETTFSMELAQGYLDDVFTELAE
ncbi:hypothetical protein ACQCT5_06485 [Sutcliffiella halmapala]